MSKYSAPGERIELKTLHPEIDKVTSGLAISSLTAAELQKNSAKIAEWWQRSTM